MARGIKPGVTVWITHDDPNFNGRKGTVTNQGINRYEWIVVTGKERLAWQSRHLSLNPPGAEGLAADHIEKGK